MTVGLVRMDNNTVAALNGTSDALARLAQWVEAASHAHTLVAPLVGTAFVPDAYKPKVDPRATPEQKQEAYDTAVANATAAVLQGLSLGIDPLVALQQIYIVHGRPGMYAAMMVALVQGHGHDVWTEDESDTRVTMAGRRKGTDVIERVTVTMDQARKAGWTSNAAYTKTPRDMLWARAASRVCNRIASDVLKGIASVEEIRDTIQVTAEAGTRTVNPPAARRRAIPPPVDAVEEPPLDDPADGHPVPSEPQKAVQAVDEPPIEIDGPALITGPQSKKLHALLGKTGRGDRDLGLVYIAGVIGREITTTKDLTLAEAGDIIDALDLEAREREREQNVADEAGP
jgi:hypothetical protein